MTISPDKPTRFSADLIDAAEVEGRRSSRSTKQQLDHWVRIGRAVDMRQTTRIAEALGGPGELAKMSAPERFAVNAQIDAAIQEAARSTSLGAQLAVEGVTTVSIDAEGNLVRFYPDGTTEQLQ